MRGDEDLWTENVYILRDNLFKRNKIQKKYKMYKKC